MPLDAAHTLEALTEAVVVIDRSGIIKLVNSATEKLLGYSRAELVGQHLSIIIPERARKRHIQHCEDYFANPYTRALGMRFVFPARCKDGTEVRVMIALAPANGGAVALITPASEDTIKASEFLKRIHMIADAVVRIVTQK